ncbi:MAG: alpha-E domain-containing protein [Citrobacter freundii]|nr:MAG: alpha-E domain-containing protein [Citrobacter freundii]
MLSRIADSLFWLSRYMERSDCLTRVIRTNYILSFDSSSLTDFSWKDVIQLFSPTTDENILQHGDNISNALVYLITNTKNINSAKVLTTRARENARGVQDNITKEVWEQVNQQYHFVNHPSMENHIRGTRTLDMIEMLDQNSILFYGVTDSTMPRGQGWNFMNLGKFLERSILSIDTTYAHFQKMGHLVNQPQDILFWKNLLLSLSGYELYLKSYTHGQHNMNVIDHIIFNEDFPRSVIYSLERTRRYLDEIVEDTKMEGSPALQKSFGRICSKVEFADMNMIQEEGLPNFLFSLRNDLVNFSNQLTRIYFSYA